MALRLIGDAVRAICLSWELVMIAAVVATWHLAPGIPEFVGLRIKADRELWEWVFAAPVAVLAWSGMQARAALFPASAEVNQRLHEWGDYWRFKMRVLIALSWIGLASVVSICMWVLKSEISSAVIGSVFLVSLSVSIVATVSLWLAAIRVREIVER